jgi:hypothetical protein
VPVFVILFRSPGIDFQPGGPVRKPYLSYLPAQLSRLAKSIPRNRFLGSINVYKYGLWRAGTPNRVAVQARQVGIDSWAQEIYKYRPRRRFDAIDKEFRYV